MSQKLKIHTIAVQGLSGSVVQRVDDLDMSKATVSLYSAAASGSVDVQASVDGLNYVSLIGGPKVNTSSAALSAVVPQTSGSYMFVRLVSPAGQNGMGGSVTGSISGPPFDALIS